MEQPKKVELSVQGMTCTNCAQTVSRQLEKSGLQNVNVNFSTGEVSFRENKTEAIDKAVDAINSLGYHVVSRSDIKRNEDNLQHHQHTHDDAVKKQFIISLIFTLPLLLHMVVSFHFLHNAVFQLAMTLPVMYIGINRFGKSAWSSLKGGVPNMDVLVITGVLAAFIYSLAGMYLYPGSPNYLFFETAATIVTLVLLGNLIEHRSVKRTTTAIAELKNLQPKKAKKVVADAIVETDIEDFSTGDIFLANSGDRISFDGKIISGKATIDESLLSGESLPVEKKVNDEVTGGTLLSEGSIKVKIEKTGDESTLHQIIELVKDAANNRPAIQKLGDKISAIFVPVVIGIALLTFILSYFILHISIEESLMRSIAVLVISCPCAMGLAAPTAVMVGIGRAAKRGILIKGGNTLEEMSKIKTVVFDKTGTITTGKFRISNINLLSEETEAEVKSILYSMEIHSSHPIAKSVVSELQSANLPVIGWKYIEEDKGVGVNGTDDKGDLYSVGSFMMVSHFHDDAEHNIYVLKNNRLIATVDLTDELNPGAKETIAYLQSSGIKTILLSGDREKVVAKVAAETGIKEFYFAQSPKDKINFIAHLAESEKVAMVGDGINDAPALAKASVGISLSNATEAAIQSSQIILLAQKDLRILLQAMSIGRLTYSTIKQNFFWAFFYNILAIPIAAAGFLSPMVAALSMAFSDVIVVGNSLRLRTRKIK